MTELDPYAVLGVPRSASREEIARAYRRQAKRFHPDAGAAVRDEPMARINEAWHILSDPARRARWDRAHTIVEPQMDPAPTAAGRADAARRRPPRTAAGPPTVRDSGWLAVAVVGTAGAVIALVMAGIGLASSPGSVDDGPRFTTDELSFANPEEWHVAAGEDDQPTDHRVLAHVVTFGIEPASLCTNVAQPCGLTGDTVPPGEASILVTAWETGTPPVPDPIQRRAYGLDAQRIIGGEPAAFRLDRHEESAMAWWQLSPPGFPDRWIEVRADIGGQQLEQNDLLSQIDGLLATVRFGP